MLAERAASNDVFIYDIQNCLVYCTKSMILYLKDISGIQPSVDFRFKKLHTDFLTLNDIQVM